MIITWYRSSQLAVSSRPHNVWHTCKTRCDIKDIVSPYKAWKIVNTSVSTKCSFLSSFACLLALLHSRYKCLKLQRVQYLDYSRVFRLHSSRITKIAYDFVFSVDYNSSTIAMACLIRYNERLICRLICSTSLATPQTSSKVWACMDSFSCNWLYIIYSYSDTMPLIVNVSG